MKTRSRDGGGVVAPSDRKKCLISKDLSLGEQTSYTIFSISWLSYLHLLGVTLILILQIIHVITCVVFRQNAMPVLICMQNSTEEAKRVHLFVFVFELLESFSGSSENVEGWVQNTIIFLQGN